MERNGEQLSAPLGRFGLARHRDRGTGLRAWDAADEYLLAQLAEIAPAETSSMLIVNDRHGALATALATYRPSMLSDSYLAHRATEQNLAANGIDVGAVTLLGSLDPLPPQLDVIVVKIPKSLALLEVQLSGIATSLHAGSVVVAAGMTRHVHTSTLEVFERTIGATRTSLARKKARLIHVTYDPELPRSTNRSPSKYVTGSDAVPGRVLGGGAFVISHAGVFSAERLDPGTALMLEHLSIAAQGNAPERIVDLGCGSGVLGMAAAMQHADAEVVFVDQSFLAVASAEATFRANLGSRPARFVVGDCLEELRSGAPVEPGSVDLIVTNPPFHDDHAVSDAVAWQMFGESHRALGPGGELWVVGNRHLGHHAKLRHLFGNCRTVASNPRFVVLRATRETGLRRSGART